jgi:hypothetical protein
MNYITELIGGKKFEITEERAEILMKIISEEKRPEYIDFSDINGRKVLTRVDNIAKIYDARTDVQAWMDSTCRRSDEKFNG